MPQLPLALRYPPDQRLDTFVAAPPGSIAQLLSLAREPGADWIYLEGVAGSGKTHLALGVCAAAEQAGRRTAYLPLASAQGRVEQALESLEGHDVAAIDGLDSIAGDRVAEVALFDFHNRARASGLGVLYAARQAPEALPLTLPDLRSRLSQTARVRLHALDDAGRADVLRDRALRRGLVLEDAAIDWMLARTDRNLASLVALLDRLDRESLAAQRRITVPFLRRVVEDAG